MDDQEGYEREPEEFDEDISNDDEEDEDMSDEDEDLIEEDLMPEMAGESIGDFWSQHGETIVTRNPGHGFYQTSRLSNITDYRL